MRRTRRTSQTGQVVVVTALMGTVILGAMALTVDLSLHTFNQRTLQNVADAAALAGATDLGTTPTGAQEQQGITDALSAIKLNQGFATGWTGGSTATTCTNSAGISGYCETVTYKNYTVKISAPPQTANGSSNRTASNFEVDMFVTVSNNFGAFVGTATSTVGAHAVAYNSGPPSPYNYTFFSAKETDSGNQQESITGDAYLGAGYQPQAAQSGGHSGLCVYQVPETGNDTDGDTTADNDLDEKGHVVFSSATPTVGIEPSYSQSTAPCSSSTAGLNAQASAPVASGTNCPTGSVAGADASQPGGYNCWVANPPVPAVQLPTCGTGTGVPAADCHTGVCTQTIDSQSSGIYVVNASAACTVTLDFSNPVNAGNISCVDIVLGTGAQVVVNNKKANHYVTSYSYNTIDGTANAAITTIGATPPATSCPGAALTSSTQVYNCVICAPATTGNPVALSNNSTGCCSDTLFIGSVFLPGQQIAFTTNQAMEDVGQIYCGYWNVQSGNHPNPTVTHDNGATDLIAETLRLVE